jgi:hypothetical protein
MSTFQPYAVAAKAWWEEESGDIASRILFATMRTWDQTTGIQQGNIRNMRLYSNKELGSLNIANYITNVGSGSDASSQNQTNAANRVSLNVIKSCVDTLCAKIAKNKIKVQFLTSGGTLEQQTRGRQLTKFMFGHQQETNAMELYKLAFRDALIFGTGFVKTIREGGKIRKERVFPDEVMTDPADGYYGNPRTLYQRRFVAKATLAEMFPEHAETIGAAQQVDMFRGDAVEPMLLVVEAWRLPCEEKGRRVLAIDGCALIDEEYKHDYFPFAVMRYSEPLLGFFGGSLPEEIAGIQLEINRVCRHIQECQRLISYPRIFVEMSSKVNPGHFVNGIGTFVPYSGTAPQVSTPQAVGAEVYNWLETLIRRAYEMSGISMLSANSQKPTGLDSGKALMVYNDIESERFVLLGQAFEKFIVDDCLRSCMLFRDGDVVSSAAKMEGLEKLRWGDIKLPNDQYLMQTFPVSSLPNTPAAKLQMVTDLKNEGYIQPEEAAELLDYPDLDSNAMVRLSPLKLIRKALENALLDGEYTPPEPFLPLPIALKTAQAYFCWAQLNKFPEERLALVQQYIEDCIAIQMAAAPMPVAPVGPGQQILEQQLGAPVTAQQPLTPAIMPT